MQIVTQFMNGQVQGVRFVRIHKTSGEGDFLVAEYRDATGAVYEVAQSTNEVTYFNSMRGGATAASDTRPAVTCEQAQKLALDFARQHVRGFDGLSLVSTYKPEPNAKGNTCAFEWISNLPALRSKQYYFEGTPVPAPPYRVLVVINSKGDLVEFLNDTY